MLDEMMRVTRQAMDIYLSIRQHTTRTRWTKKSKHVFRARFDTHCGSPFPLPHPYGRGPACARPLCPRLTSFGVLPREIVPFEDQRRPQGS